MHKKEKHVNITKYNYEADMVDWCEDDKAYGNGSGGFSKINAKYGNHEISLFSQALGDLIFELTLIDYDVENTAFVDGLEHIMNMLIDECEMDRNERKNIIPKKLPEVMDIKNLKSSLETVLTNIPKDLAKNHKSMKYWQDVRYATLRFHELFEISKIDDLMETTREELIEHNKNPYELLQQWFDVMKYLRRPQLKKGKKTQITRKTAEILMGDVLKRTKEINQNNEFPYIVKEVWVFGSYLDKSKNKIGDVDIDIVLNKRNPETYDEQHDDYIRNQKRSGRRFNTYLDEILAPRTDIIKFIKNKSRGISITENELQSMGDCPKKLVYHQ